MSVVGQSTSKHFGFPKYRPPVPIDDRKSNEGRHTGQSGNFNKSADERPTVYGLRSTSTVYCSICGSKKDETLLKTFFFNKLWAHIVTYEYLIVFVIGTGIICSPYLWLK